mgnify:FL=1
MIDKICLFLTNKIQKKMPEIDDERTQVINYGLQILIGEIPKIFIVLLIAWILGIFKLTLITFLLIMPYRSVSGGFHLHTHIGCIIATTLTYCGTAFVSQYIVLNDIVKYILILLIWIFSMAMIKLYSPADTEEVPILETKVRQKKQLASYIIATISLIAAIFIRYNVISNILIIGTLLQTLFITKVMYKLTNNKYGYEVY